MLRAYKLQCTVHALFLHTRMHKLRYKSSDAMQEPENTASIVSDLNNVGNMPFLVALLARWPLPLHLGPARPACGAFACSDLRSDFSAACAALYNLPRFAF